MYIHYGVPFMGDLKKKNREILEEKDPKADYGMQPTEEDAIERLRGYMRIVADKQKEKKEKKE